MADQNQINIMFFFFIRIILVGIELLVFFGIWSDSFIKKLVFIRIN